MLLSIIKSMIIYITCSYPPVDGRQKVTTAGSSADWNPIIVTSPYPGSIMTEDADSNKVRRFICYAREKQPNYMNHPIYSTLHYSMKLI